MMITYMVVVHILILRGILSIMVMNLAELVLDLLPAQGDMVAMPMLTTTIIVVIPDRCEKITVVMAIMEDQVVDMEWISHECIWPCMTMIHTPCHPIQLLPVKN